MAITGLMNRHCTITRRTPGAGVDVYGNPTDGVQLIGTVCELQQQQSNERTIEGDLVGTVYLLVLPAGTEIGPGDMVSVQETVLEVEGDPERVVSAKTGEEHHVEAQARRGGGKT